jgi:riboflavin biosynthesis pyrimidine reductase
MRALLPESAGPVDLHAWYGRNWLETGGVRANFIASVDGAASAGGLSRGLQTEGDNRVFAALRDLADVILVGAGTARAEGYAAVTATERRLEVRRRYGLPDALPIAVVSVSLDLDASSALFTGALPGARTIVVTTDGSPADRRTALAEVADVVVCGEQEIDVVRLRAELSARGLSRVLCEGGPSLFGHLVQHGGCDELCLTISPLLVGPGPGRIVAGPTFGRDPRGLTLDAVLEEDGALFARYRRSL